MNRRTMTVVVTIPFLLAKMSAFGIEAPASTSIQSARVFQSEQELLERVRALLMEVPLIDGHNDLAHQTFELLGSEPDPIDLTIVQDEYPADLPRLRQGMVGGQFWSAYVDVSHIDTGTELLQAIRAIDLIPRYVDKYPEDLEFARTSEDVWRIFRSGKVASMIGIEGGHAIRSSLSALRMVWELGIRYMTLTHFATIDWADAATDTPRNNGLSEFGEQVVREMNRLGMFVDLSHVSAETMQDALRVSRAPVIYSHSSAQVSNMHPRNVPDEILPLVATNGGVIMVNFIPNYVAPSAEEWTERQTVFTEELHARLDDEAEIGRQLAAWKRDHPAPRGTISDVVDSIDRIRDLAGIDHVGIGSDYYDPGGISMADGLDDISRFPYLFIEMLRRGYADEDVKKVAGLNLLRAMKQMEDVAAELRVR